MSYVGRDFDPAHPTESEVFSLDFVNVLQSGETIKSVSSVSLTVFQGTDVDPASHLSGSPNIFGTIVSQRIGGAGAPGGGLIVGVTYTIAYTVFTSLRNIITLYSRIPCRAIN
jgi:hypothetical protein